MAGYPAPSVKTAGFSGGLQDFLDAAQNYRNMDFVRCYRIPWLHGLEPIDRRCTEMKHAYNGVSFAADVSAPRKV